MRGRAIWFAVLMSCSNGDGQTQQPPAPDASRPAATCGDGVCAASEVGACSADCGMPPMAACGNGTCETGESNATCPGDCAAGGAVCGDGTCTGPAETAANCPGDCSGGGGSGGMAACGNLVCETGEDATSCPLDCGGGGGASTCPGGDDVGCFFCWFDPTQCVPPQTEQICEQCLGLGP